MDTRIVVLLLGCFGFCFGTTTKGESNTIPMPSTSRRPTPGCMSPIDVTTDSGVRIANYSSSRVDYSVMRHMPFGEKSEVRLEFRSQARHGLLMMIHAPDTYDWVGVFIYKGYLRYSFSCSSAATNAILTYRDKPVNRAKWHKLSLLRTTNGIILDIDGQQPFKKYRTPCMDLTTISIGGADARERGFLKRQGFLEATERHTTCFRNFRHLYDGVDFTSPSQAVYQAVSSCIWMTQ